MQQILPSSDMKSCWTWDVLCSNIVTLSYAKVTIVWWCLWLKIPTFLETSYHVSAWNPLSRVNRWRQSHCRHGHRVEDMPGSESCSTQFWKQNRGAKFGQEVKTSPPIFNVFFWMIWWVGWGWRWLDDLSQQMIGWRLRLVVYYSRNPLLHKLSERCGQVTTRPWWSEIQKERIVFQPSIFRGYDGLC